MNIFIIFFIFTLIFCSDTLYARENPELTNNRQKNTIQQNFTNSQSTLIKTLVASLSQTSTSSFDQTKIYSSSILITPQLNISKISSSSNSILNINKTSFISPSQTSTISVTPQSTSNIFLSSFKLSVNKTSSTSSSLTSTSTQSIKITQSSTPSISKTPSISLSQTPTNSLFSQINWQKNTIQQNFVNKQSTLVTLKSSQSKTPSFTSSLTLSVSKTPLASPSQTPTGSPFSQVDDDFETLCFNFKNGDHMVLNFNDKVVFKSKIAFYWRYRTNNQITENFIAFDDIEFMFKKTFKIPPLRNIYTINLLSDIFSDEISTIVLVSDYSISEEKGLTDLKEIYFGNNFENPVKKVCSGECSEENGKCHAKGSHKLPIELCIQTLRKTFALEFDYNDKFNNLINGNFTEDSDSCS